MAEKAENVWTAENGRNAENAEKPKLDKNGYRGAIFHTNFKAMDGHL